MSALPQPLVPVPKKDDIISITKSLIEERWQIIQSIIGTVTTETACFDNTLGLLARYDDEVSGTMHIIQVLKYASPDQEVQACVEDVDKLWGEHSNAEQNQMDLVQLIQAAAEKKEGLNPEADRMLMKKTSWYNQLGYGNIDNETRQKFLQTKNEIKDLCAKFNRNIRLYDGGHLLFTDEQLDGLANADLEQFEKGSDGKRRVPLTRGNLSLVCRKAHDPNTRKSIDEEWAKRLPENVPIFRKVILLRDENARRMGYKSYAEFCLPDKMAKSTAWLDQLHDGLAKRMIPRGREYFKKKEEMKRNILKKEKQGTQDDELVHPWDIPYIDRLLAEEDNVDYDAISEYLPFKHTVDAVLSIFAEYLQISLEPVTGDALVGNTWSDEVTVWVVRDISPAGRGNFVGYLYGDFEDRKNKYKHNQTVTVQPSYLRPDGSRVYPSTILMCSFAPYVVDGCKLLRHQNIKTLIHEFGHAIHELFARTKYSRFHGYRVSLEFGEAIGTMMENFAWSKSLLQEVGRHYTYINNDYRGAWMKRNTGCEQPPEIFPDSLLDSLIGTRAKNKLQGHAAQLAHSIFDLTVHNPATHDELENMDETRLFIELEEKFRFLKPEGVSYPQADFSHLVSGYGAGYYAYICSNVFGEELFDSNFANDPRNKNAWARFRRELLRFGGSRDETELLEEFLGRPPNINAFLKRIGIEPEE